MLRAGPGSPGLEPQQPERQKDSKLKACLHCRVQVSLSLGSLERSCLKNYERGGQGQSSVVVCLPPMLMVVGLTPTD